MSEPVEPFTPDEYVRQIASLHEAHRVAEAELTELLAMANMLRERGHPELADRTEAEVDKVRKMYQEGRALLGDDWDLPNHWRMDEFGHGLGEIDGGDDE